MLKRILVAHNGWDGAWEAFDIGVELALELIGTLHAACIEGDRHLCTKQPDEVRDANAESDSHPGGQAQDCGSRAALKGLDIETTAWPGHAVKAIMDLTRKEAFDLLVVRDAGHSSIYEHIWDRPFCKLRGRIPCSLLMVK